MPTTPPQDWLDLYAAHDGEGDAWVSGTFLDLKFLPLTEVYRVLLEMQGILEYADPWEPDEDEVDPRIAQDFPSLGLLPVFDDMTGNYIGVDLQPGPAGTFGQAVVFGADYFGAQYVAPSLNALFTWVTGEAQQGRIIVKPHDPPVPNTFTLCTHPQHPMDTLIRAGRSG